MQLKNMKILKKKYIHFYKNLTISNFSLKFTNFYKLLIIINNINILYNSHIIRKKNQQFFI
jgi:hypothetical protein